MANLDQIMDYLADHVVYTKSFSEELTVAANARSYKSYQLGLPAGARVISVVLRNSPNADWVIFRSYLQDNDTSIKWFYHNEHNGQLTGSMTFDVHYVID